MKIKRSDDCCWQAHRNHLRAHILFCTNKHIANNNVTCISILFHNTNQQQYDSERIYINNESRAHSQQIQIKGSTKQSSSKSNQQTQYHTYKDIGSDSVQK